jgi:hypothetical protein
LRKVTVVLPADLLERATLATGKGIAPTIREGLEAMAALHAFEGLRKLRGKVKLTLDCWSRRCRNCLWRRVTGSALGNFALNSLAQQFSRIAALKRV